MKSFGFVSPAASSNILQQRWLLSVMAFAVFAALLTPTCSWAGWDDPDIVYIESNLSSGNSILAFRNDGSGKLTFIGSTPAGGKCAYDPTVSSPPRRDTNDTDQPIQISSDRGLLFAVNS